MGIDLAKYSKGKFYSLGEVFDLKPPPRERIAVVKEGQFDKPVLVFESGRQAGLNRASLGVLMRDLGADTDHWIGQWVELTAGQVRNQFNEPMDALVVRPVEPALAMPSSPSPQTPPRARKASADMDMDDEIPF
jgi:hypothetical protein